MKPMVQRDGEGHVLEVMASRVTIRVRAEDTGGAFSVVEMQVPAGFQAPPLPHRHIDVDWYAFVEDGEIANRLRGLGRRPTPSDMTAIARPLWTQYGVEVAHQ